MKQTLRRIMASVLSLALILTSVLTGMVIPAAAASAEGNPELSRAAAAEGMVLLENREENGSKALPIKEGSTVAMFGRAMINYVRGGGGSGNTNVDYMTNILEGFQEYEEAGKITLVPELVDFYEANVTESTNTTDDAVAVTDEMIAAAAEQTDIAVVTIGRTSSEGSDRNATKGDYYLSDAEYSLISRVSASFEKTIVLLNIGAVMDTSWIKGEFGVMNEPIEGLDAVLVVWQGGMEGGGAAADVVMGTVTPSGKTVDTWAQDYSCYPSSTTFKESNSYVNYTEDIFVGYRYFETIPGAAEKVNYEFGYGLSYTDFETVVDKVEVVDDQIVVTATVTNTGSVAGMEVVQVYFSAPRGDLTKPAKELAAYDKTGELAPGASETLVMSFDITDMSSYDDTGVIQKSAYVMEAGDYRFFVGNSVRDGEYADFVYTVEEDLVAEQLSELCAPVQLKQRLTETGEYVDVVAVAEGDLHHTVAAEGQTRVEMEAYINGSDAVRVEAFYDSNLNRNKCLAYMNAVGRFAEYELTVEAEGQYAIYMCYANGHPSSTNCVAVTVDGELQTNATLNAPQTGDGDGADEWYNFVMSEEPMLVNLHEGVNLLRFTSNIANGPNYDYMILERVGAIDGAYSRKVAAEGVTRIEAESFEETGAGVDGTATRLENFTYDDGTDGTCVAYMNYEGNFVRYYIHVEEAGAYELTFNAANGRAAYDFQPGIMVDDEVYPVFITADRTCAGSDDWDGDGVADADWYGFADLEPVTINLPKGNCVLQLTGIVQNQYPNIDYFTLERVGETIDRSIDVSATQTTRVEAENYQEATWPDSLYPCRVENYAVADVSGSCLAFMNYPGNTVTYYLNAENAGSYVMTLAAANGYEAYDNFEPNIVINGVSYPATLNVPSTRDDGEGGTGNRWYNFIALDPVQIELKEGLNVLTMTCTVEDAFPNLEYFTLEPVPFERTVSATGTTTIQAETYDASGGVASRTSNFPKTEDFTVNGGGTCLAYMNYAGNYVEYNIYVEEAGSYDLELYAANGRAGFNFQPGIYVDDEAFPAFLICDQTGDGDGAKEWYNFEALEAVSINLPAGNCTLKLWAPTASYPNVDYFTLTRTGEAADRVAAVPAEGARIEAENFQTFVAGEENRYPVRLENYSTDAGEGTILAFMNYIGNQVGYYLDVAEAGTYNITLNIANGYEGYEFNPRITVNGTTYNTIITCNQTGDGDGAGEWYNFEDLEAIQVELPAGRVYLTMTAQANDQFPNVDFFTITPAVQATALATTTLTAKALNAAAPASTGKIMLIDVYNDPELMPDFLDQLTIEELAQLLSAQGNRDGGNTQGWGNNMEYGIPLVMTADGPQGIRISTNCTAWPISTCLACTWNVDTVYAVGVGAATEAHNNNMDIWLAPGMNNHRDPLCGRNFEYYSEDPLLTGKMAASITKGCQSQGVAISLKHFAANNKETNRTNSDSRMSERALREIYLKGFEIAVKEGDPWTIMSSYNLINGTETAENYELLTGILRTEWGYNGVVETDWGNNSNHVYEVLAGNDVKMTNSQPDQLVAAVESGKLTREMLETGAERVLNLIMKVNYFQDKIVNIPIVEIGDDTNFKAAENIIWNNTARTEATSDTDGGSNLGYCDAGAWVQYEINVLKGGSYTLKARVASSAGSGGFDVVIDGETIAHFECPNTGGYQNWITIQTDAAVPVTLTEGRHTMRFEWTESGSNLNWIQFTRERVPAAGVTLDTVYSKLNIGDTLTLNASVNPANAEDVSVTWSSDNEAVAAVDENGVVTAVAEGGAVITVTTNDGAFTASCTIIVEDPNGVDTGAIKEAVAAAEAAQAAAEAAQAKAEEAQAAAEAAQAAAEEAAASAAEDKAAAEAAKTAAELAKAQAEAAKAAAEEAQTAAENAAKAAEDSNAEAAKEAAAAAASAKASAESAAAAAGSAQTVAEAAKNAQDAQAAAEEAQTAAEEAAASAAEDKAAAEAAKTAAELAKAQAEAAKAAAETAKTAAEAAAKAAAESNVEAAKEAAAAAESAKASAESAAAAAGSAQTAAEAAKAAQDAQAKAEAAQKAAEDAAKDAAADKEAVEQAKKEAEDAAAQAAADKAAADKAAAEAALSVAKYNALVELNEYADSLKEDATEMEQEALSAAVKAAREAINGSAGEAAIAEALESGIAALDNALCLVKNFTDVDLDAWYHDAVDFVLKEGIMNGNGDGTFAPTEALTRAMLVQILYNIEGRPEVETEKSFSDVEADDWYYDAILWAAENEIVLGYEDGSFGAEDNVTREQMVTILYRYAGEPDVTAQEIIFADSDEISDWAVDAVLWAYESGIVQGVGNDMFDPAGASQRAAAAQVMMNYFGK